MSKCQNVGRFITLWTRNMNAGKLYAIRALKHPAKYAYSTLSRSTSVVSCVSVVKWIPSVSHVQMSKCGTLYRDSDQKYEALRYPSTQTPCQYAYPTLWEGLFRVGVLGCYGLGFGSRFTTVRISTSGERMVGFFLEEGLDSRT